MDSNEIIKIVVNIFELVAVVVAFIYYKNAWPRYWKILAWLLAFVFFTEIAGKLLYHYSKPYYNVVLYRYLHFPFYISTTLFLLTKPFNNGKYYLLISLGIYFIAFIIENILMPGGGYNFGSFSYQIGVLAMIIIALKYFQKLIKSDLILNYKTDMHFWFAIATLLSTLIGLPFDALRMTLYKKSEILFINYWRTIMLFNCIAYCTIVWGIISSFGVKKNHSLLI